MSQKDPTKISENHGDTCSSKVVWEVIPRGLKIARLIVMFGLNFTHYGFDVSCFTNIRYRGDLFHFQISPTTYSILKIFLVEVGLTCCPTNRFINLVFEFHCDSRHPIKHIFQVGGTLGLGFSKFGRSHVELVSLISVLWVNLFRKRQQAKTTRPSKRTTCPGCCLSTETVSNSDFKKERSDIVSGRF